MPLPIASQVIAVKVEHEGLSSGETYYSTNNVSSDRIAEFLNALRTTTRYEPEPAKWVDHGRLTLNLKEGPPMIIELYLDEMNNIVLSSGPTYFRSMSVKEFRDLVERASAAP